jgi:OOP family OmpA-OmpF porin
LVGYTDQTGSSTYNFLLGRERAESVKRFLINNYGVALYRMFISSEGKLKPVALPDEKDANSKNRRVVLKLWGQL